MRKATRKAALNLTPHASIEGQHQRGMPKRKGMEPVLAPAAPFAHVHMRALNHMRERAAANAVGNSKPASLQVSPAAPLPHPWCWRGR